MASSRMLLSKTKESIVFQIFSFFIWNIVGGVLTRFMEAKADSAMGP